MGVNVDVESTQLNIFEQQGSKAFLIGFFPFFSHDSSQGSEDGRQCAQAGKVARIEAGSTTMQSGKIGGGIEAPELAMPGITRQQVSGDTQALQVEVAAIQEGDHDPLVDQVGRQISNLLGTLIHAPQILSRVMGDALPGRKGPVPVIGNFLAVLRRKLAVILRQPHVQLPQQTHPAVANRPGAPPR